MIKKITLSIFLYFLFIINAHAGSPLGGQVTYRSLGNYKFEVTYKIYRDCRGIPLSVPDYMIRCGSSGTTKKLSGTRSSIKDITPYCAKAGSPCNPQNTTSGTGFEEHTYLDTLDFNGSESSFKSCCVIQIGVGQCCRQAAITTGASGYDFWVYSTLDLCKATGNSSPVFSFNPNFYESANEIVTKSYLAKDTIDNDSLSYHFTDPLSSWTGKTNWTGSNIDSKNPFSAYYPSGYNIAYGPKPENNPPYGIYLDAISGNLIAMPVNSNEATIMAIAVKEWRKDNTGKYVQIGEVVIDHTIFFSTGTNHTPQITQKINHKVCEGQTFTLDIPTDDYPTTQPPPASTIRNDTVKLSWDKGIKNASYSIPNPNVKLPTGKFQWTPATGDSKKPPFMFSAIAVDNNCPWKSFTVKTFKLTVYPKINVNTSVKKINNFTYAAGITISNKKYNYVAGKSIISTVQADIRNYYFKSSNSLYSTAENDTIVFKKNGTYIISQSFISETECNSVVLNDTITINNLLEVTFGYDPLGMFYSDTSVCQNQVARMTAKVSNSKRPVTYTWKTKTKTLTDTLGYFDLVFSATDTLFVSVKDANGQTNSTFRTVTVLELPEIYAGADSTICPENTIKLKAKNNKPGVTIWKWTKDNTTLGITDSVFVSASGNYIVSGTNGFGCSLSDTLKISHYTPIKIQLLSGLFCQDINEIDQANIIKNSQPNSIFDKITWKLLKSLPRTAGGENTLGDVLTDLDPTASFNYAINFGESRVTLFSNKDSLKFVATAIDTNGCGSLDTMTVSILKKPYVTLFKKQIDNCKNQSFNLDSFGTSTNTYKWIPFFRDGFESWISYAPLSSPIISANYFTKAGKYKIKIEANNESCINVDSLVLNILALPRPLIGLLKYPNAIRFRDETINEKSHKWYINNVFYSSDDTLLLSKTFVHLQPIKLEVTDNLGCTNDTTVVINTLIGIKTIESSGVEVFPNPANTFLVLKQTESWVPSHYEIYDVLGRKVLSGITKNKAESIDIKNIKSGSYYLKYLTEEGILSIAFIKSE